MPDDPTQTVRDLLAGFNSMQMQLGLTPASGQAGGLAMQTSPVFQPPKTKSAGEAAQEASDRISQQVHQNLSTQPGTGYGADFSRRMAQIQAGYLPMQQAQSMAMGRGQQGFMGAPSPIYQTAPSMGVFRPPMPMPPAFGVPPMTGAIPQPYMPMWPGQGMRPAGPDLGQMLPNWFGAPAPAARFTDPYQRQASRQDFEANQAFAQNAAMIPGMAFGATTAGAAAMGMGAGGAFGSRFGGRMGAVGAALGAAGGAAIGYFGAGELAEGAANRLIAQPMVQTRAYGEQIQDLTRGFVTRGPELHRVGRGLSQQAAQGLAGKLEGLVESGQAGNFNMRDLMGVTNQAAQGGMLDMAQSGDQIANQVRNVAKGLQSFMKIAQEPDVRKAMEMMSSMRTMGMTIPETQVAAQNARTFARMAGTSEQGLMQSAGMPGAYTFQNLGLTAGLGMQVGMGAAGLANQGVAGGAFTPAQLALAGGKAGLTQTITEAAGASLGTNFQTMALLSRNQQGQLSIDPERLKRVMSGHITLGEQASMAADNLQRLADQGGKSTEQVISEFTTRQNELQDELGRRLGPMGSSMLLIRNAQTLRNEMGGALDMGQALRQIAPNLTTNQISSLSRLATPEVLRGVQQQMLQEIPRMRAEEAARREETMKAGGWRATMRGSAPYRAGSATTEFVGGAGRTAWEGIQGVGSDISEWWTGDEFTETGAHIVRGMGRFQTKDPKTRKALQAWRESEAGRAAYAGLDTGGGTPTGRLTDAQQLSTLYEGLRYQAGAATQGWALMAPSAAGSEHTDVVRSLRARGGVLGAAADFAPGIVNLLAREDPNALGVTRAMMAQSAGIRDAQKTVDKGMRMSEEDLRTTRSQLGVAFKQFGGEGDVDEVETLVTNGLMKSLSENAGIFSTTPTQGEMKEEAIRIMVKAGHSRESAQQYIGRTWDKGLGPVVMQRIQKDGPPKAVAAITRIRDADPGAIAGKSVKKLRDEARDLVSETRSDLAGKGIKGWFVKPSEETVKAFEEIAIQSIGKEELAMINKAKKARDAGDTAGAAKLEQQAAGKLIAQAAYAARREDRPEEADRLDKELEALGLSKDDLDRVRKGARADYDVMDADKKEALRTFGKSAVQEDKGAVGAFAAKNLSRSLGTRDRVLGIGVAKVAERRGMDAAEVRRKSMEDTDEGRALKKEIDAASESAREDEGLGGRGKGGDEERKAVDAAGQVGDLASAIPDLRAASANLNSSAKELSNTMAAVRLRLNQPGR